MFEKYIKRIVALIIDAVMEHLEDRLKNQVDEVSGDGNAPEIKPEPEKAQTEAERQKTHEERQKKREEAATPEALAARGKRREDREARGKRREDRKNK
jgi:hypothetical protein